MSNDNIRIVYSVFIYDIVKDWNNKQHSRAVDKLKKRLKKFIHSEMSRDMDNFTKYNQLSIDIWSYAVEAIRANDKQADLLGNVDAYVLIGFLYEHEADLMKSIVSPKLIEKVVCSNRGRELTLKFKAKTVANIVNEMFERTKTNIDRPSVKGNI